MRWESAKTGKSGYSPAYTTEGKRKFYEEWKARRGSKPPVASGDRILQDYLPVTDEEIAKHLRGTQVMGVYPLLLDETCWFLAADFDRGSWPEDVGAFVATCSGDAHREARQEARGDRAFQRA